VLSFDLGVVLQELKSLFNWARAGGGVVDAVDGPVRIEVVEVRDHVGSFVSGLPG